MGESKGFVITLVFFLLFAVPVTLMFAKDAIEQHAFMKMTTELSVVVKEEGGVTGSAASLVNEMEQKGYEIQFSSYGKVPYGTTITANFEYKYKNFFIKERVLRKQNTIQILKR